MKNETIIEDLNWRYATKKFDSSKKVSDENIEVIKEILRLTPTSYGLQGLKFVIVENPAIRKEIQEAAWNQEQVAEASHLIVFCYTKDLNSTHVDNYMKLVSETRNTPLENLDGFGTMIKNTIAGMTDSQMGEWLTKQVYIALGQLLTGLSQMRIDSTPMEGFSPMKVDEILELDQHGLSSVLLCPIGYRHEDDKAQFQKKVRQSKEEMFLTV